MPATLQASRLSLYDVKSKFHLHQAPTDSFFSDLLNSAQPLSELEKQQLDRTKQQYLYLADHPLLEVTVKMVTLSPLLSKVFSLSEPENHLYLVLQILKSLGQLVISI